MFRITLHIDDIEVPFKIKKFLNVGHIEIRKDSCVFIIRKTSDLMDVIIPLIDKNKLHTSKYLDFLDFKACVTFIYKQGSVVKFQDLEWIKICIKGMNLGRTEIKPSLLPEIPLNKIWLLGFIEGEGTFGLKALVPYFQEAQHNKNFHILENINKILLELPNLFYGSSIISPLNTNQTFNIRTNVLSLAVNSIDSLHDIIVLNFLSLEFQTQKIVEFMYWALVLYMHKFGYFYLPEGRKLAVKISNYINKSRYSNSGKNPPIPEINQSIFETPLPVNLKPYMSHLEFAKIFSRIQDKNLIWVYDKDILVGR